MKFKQLVIGFAVAGMSILMGITAFAGAWQKDGRGWWYQESSGYPKSQWKEIDGQWYYFHSDGYMAYNTWIGNYYLGSSGAMLRSTLTPDNYYVGADGAWDGKRGYDADVLNRMVIAMWYPYYEYELEKSNLRDKNAGFHAFKYRPAEDFSHFEERTMYLIAGELGDRFKTISGYEPAEYDNFKLNEAAYREIIVQLLGVEQDSSSESAYMLAWKDLESGDGVKDGKWYFGRGDYGAVYPIANISSFEHIGEDLYKLSGKVGVEDNTGVVTSHRFIDFELMLRNNAKSVFDGWTIEEFRVQE